MLGIIPPSVRKPFDTFRGVEISSTSSTPESVLMASFGENLRREREMRGVSLQEISAATKISVRFLQALENEEFGKLPGGIFTRSFIRAYAKYLGLDEDRVLAEYHLVTPAQSDLDISRIAMSKTAAKRQASYGGLMAVFMAALLLTGGYLLYHYTRARTPVRTPASTPTAAVPEETLPAGEGTGLTVRGPAGDSATMEGGQTAVPEGQVGAGATSTGVPEAMTAVVPRPSEGLVLQVAATERSWIAIDADGKMVLQRVLSPGEVETVRAKESFDVTTGNALGVVLTLNGETLQPLGRRGEVKSVHLTRDDAKKSPL